jgi:hypothetical protein
MLVLLSERPDERLSLYLREDILVWRYLFICASPENFCCEPRTCFECRYERGTQYLKDRDSSGCNGFGEPLFGYCSMHFTASYSFFISRTIKPSRVKMLECTMERSYEFLTVIFLFEVRLHCMKYRSVHT